MVCNVQYWYILVCTGTYQYVLVSQWYVQVYEYQYWYIMLHTVFISVYPCANMCKQVQTSTNKYKQVQTSSNHLILVYTGIYWYKTNGKRMYNYIRTNDLMHTILLIQPLCQKHDSISVTVCFCRLHIHACQHCCSVSPCGWCRTSCVGTATVTTPMQVMGLRPGPQHGLQDFMEDQASHKTGFRTAHSM